MSMFYELMMRKKEQIMYVTIKGSLTENDGVFSGFSNFACLLMQEAPTILDITKYEFCLSFVAPANSATREYLLAFLAGSREGISIINSTISCTFGRQVGTTTDFRVTSSVTLTEGDSVIVRAGYKGNGVFFIAVSVNGGNWIEDTNSIELSQLSSLESQQISIGNAYLFASKSPFTSSIDLPNSYIKLGGTKYNLQAVYGYKIVGTLTENPSGVFNGFSGSNYLIINKEFDTSKNFEIVAKANTGTIAGEMNALIRNYSATNILSFAIMINPTTRKLYSSIIDNNGNYILQNSSGETIFSNNTDFFFRFSQKEINNEYIIKIESSIDGIGWVTENIANSLNHIKVATEGLKFGAGHSSYPQYWRGSIDMNETYIKNNNKLWFNGQQA